MDLTPTTSGEVAEALAAASSAGRVVDIRGGGMHSRRGWPFTPDDVIGVGGLNRVVDYSPNDMTMTVEGGVLGSEVVRLAHGAGQAWPQAQVLPGSTVGGIVAAALSCRRRLGVGPVRDSLLEVVVATGHGRIVKGGGRTVKSVTGYDLPRLMCGSLGTLGVIVQVTLKMWPLPMAEQWYVARGTDAHVMMVADGVMARGHRPSAVIVRPGALHVCLMGAPGDVAAPAGMEIGPAPEGPSGAGIVEIGVAPGALRPLAHRLTDDGRDFEAWLGIGICRLAVGDAPGVAAAHDLAGLYGGHAQVIDGDDELRVNPFGPPPAGAEIMRRIRTSFDPAGVLCPGRFAARDVVPV